MGALFHTGLQNCGTLYGIRVTLQLRECCWPKKKEERTEDENEVVQWTIEDHASYMLTGFLH